MGFSRHLAVFALAAALAGCTSMSVPPGTPTFQAGYKDGCRSAWADVGVRGYNDRVEDEKMKANAEYQAGWGRGYGECFSVDQRTTRNRDMGSG